MQAFARGSLQKSFFGRKMEAFLASFLVNSPLASCERLRSAMASLRLSRLSLDDMEFPTGEVFSSLGESIHSIQGIGKGL